MSELKALEFWNAQGKKWIKENKDNEIELIYIVNSYFKSTKEFYEWYINKLNEIHREDFIKTRELIKEANEEC